MAYYLAPQFWTDNPELATEFNDYLAEHCCWTASDFGSGYAWETNIPPREAWGSEVQNLNEHLRELEM